MNVEPGVNDPKLVAVLDELTQVMMKHEVAGAMCIASSTHAAFRLAIPGWSAIQLEEHGIRITSDGEEHLKSSVHLVMSLRDLLAFNAHGMGWICDRVSESLQKVGLIIESSDETPEEVH